MFHYHKTQDLVSAKRHFENRLKKEINLLQIALTCSLGFLLGVAMGTSCGISSSSSSSSNFFSPFPEVLVCLVSSFLFFFAVFVAALTSFLEAVETDCLHTWVWDALQGAVYNQSKKKRKFPHTTLFYAGLLNNNFTWSSSHVPSSLAPILIHT